MINEFIQNHDQHDYLSARGAYLLSLVEVDNFDLNSYKINDAINCQNIFLKNYIKNFMICFKYSDLKLSMTKRLKILLLKKNQRILKWVAILYQIAKPFCQ